MLQYVSHPVRERALRRARRYLRPSVPTTSRPEFLGLDTYFAAKPPARRVAKLQPFLGRIAVAAEPQRLILLQALMGAATAQIPVYRQALELTRVVRLADVLAANLANVTAHTAAPSAMDQAQLESRIALQVARHVSAPDIARCLRQGAQPPVQRVIQTYVACLRSHLQDEGHVTWLGDFVGRDGPRHGEVDELLMHLGGRRALALAQAMGRSLDDDDLTAGLLWVRSSPCRSLLAAMVTPGPPPHRVGGCIG